MTANSLSSEYVIYMKDFPWYLAIEVYRSIYNAILMHRAIYCVYIHALMSYT